MKKGSKALKIQDLKHCHKVLSSDAEECTILMQGGPTDRVDRLMKRIDEDKRVMSVIESLLGYKPEYADIPKEDEGREP